jgi:4-alpha-glucanotransferase
MAHYAKKAVQKQGADMVVFEFETMTSKIHEELNKLKLLGIKIKYFASENIKAIIDL